MSKPTLIIRKVKGPLFRRSRNRSRRKKGLPIVEVDVQPSKDGNIVTCRKCGHHVECRGLSRRKVRTACEFLRDTCPNYLEENYYTPKDGHQ